MIITIVWVTECHVSIHQLLGNTRMLVHTRGCESTFSYTVSAINIQIHHLDRVKVET